jgi:ABC-type sugar transport system ATPase subunit
MSLRPSAMMLDEPTSALTQQETEHLFRLIKQLTAQGTAIIYITHRLQELRHVADEVTVLRDGKHAGTLRMEQASAQRIVEMMFGDHPPEQSCAQAIEPIHERKPPVMRVEGLGKKGHFQDISFTLHQGEVLGIAGLLGAGRTELLKALYGAEPFEQGQLVIGDTTLRQATPARMKELGMAFIPEKRKEEGSVQSLSIRENIWLAAHSKRGASPFTGKGREQRVAAHFISALSIKVPHVESPMASLSGGNQQKVVVANWLNTSPRIILFDEPTRGIDIVAKEHIYTIIREQSQRGIASIVVCSELEELFAVCHRILVMKKGTIMQEVYPPALTPHDLFVMCIDD